MRTSVRIVSSTSRDLIMCPPVTLGVLRIKICGITRTEDLRAAMELGADAIGLNFYEKSSRFVSDEIGNALQLAAVEPPPNAIGVFVNADLPTINTCVEQYGLRGIQLHGDEPPELLAQLPDLPIVRARRLDERGVAAIAADVTACRAAGRVPDAVLVDAYAPGHYGGTGKTVAWEELKNYRQWLGDIPLILAGGLTADNVAEAIFTVRPHGVDTASGVESSPGVKDLDKMQSFIQNAMSAFEELLGD